ncbi:MAG: O-antigen ligase family protein [Pirellulaceae bacterium]
MFSTNRPRLHATEPMAASDGKPSLGLLYVWATPVVAALIHLCAVAVGGLLLSGFVLMAMLGIGVMVFLAESSILPDRRVVFSWLPWMPFFAWMWTSLFWCNGLQRENIQEAILISMPVLVGVVASATIHTVRQLQRLLTMFAWSLPLLFVALLNNYRASGGELDDIGFRMGSLTSALIAAVFLAGTWRSRIRPWIGWSLCLLMAAIPGARAATLAIVGLPLIHPRLGHWTTRVALIAGTIVSAVGIFQTERFQERFFHDGGSGNLSDLSIDTVNTSGRGEAWPLILNKALERPVAGFGVGSSGFYVDEISDLGGHPHNDYLRVLFELGVVGLTLFLAVVAWQTVYLFRMLRNKEGVLQHALAAAIMGWLIFLVTSLTDNTLVYAAAYMNPLFALIGGGCGVAARQQGSARAPENDGSGREFVATATGSGMDLTTANVSRDLFRGEK